MWPRSSTTRRASSRSSAMCAASGPVQACETLVQAPVPAQVIDKGLPTTGLLAHVLVAKYADHLPLYRQEAIFAARRPGTAALDAGAVGRACAACSCSPWSTPSKPRCWIGAVLHADETPVATLAPGTGKTHRARTCGRYCRRAYSNDPQGGGVSSSLRAGPVTSCSPPSLEAWRGSAGVRRLCSGNVAAEVM
jgi:hypothetical protein